MRYPKRSHYKRCLASSGQGCPTVFESVARPEGEEPEHPVHAKARAAGVVHPLRLQKAEPGREHRVSIQEHPGSAHEEPIPGEPTGRGPPRVQDPQHDDQPGEAGERPCDVTSAGGKGESVLGSEPCTNARKSPPQTWSGTGSRLQAAKACSLSEQAFALDEAGGDVLSHRIDQQYHSRGGA